MRIRPHRARALASAVVVLCAAAVAVCPAAAHADVTSTVGWVRLAQLSPQMASVDVYLSPMSGATSAGGQPVLAHAAYGVFSPYQPVAPGDYTVALRTAGAPATTDPMVGTQVTVAAGQSYTVAALGTNAVTKVSVQNDETAISPGRADVRVIEASQRYPSASVAIGADTVVANLRAPGMAPYKSVTPGAGGLLVTTGADTQTIPANLAANSAYTVVVLDGTQGSARVLVLTDAAGISAVPKGGVNTGFGGTAFAGDTGEVHRQGYKAPLAEALLVLSMLGGTAITSIRRRRRRAAKLSAHLDEAFRMNDTLDENDTAYGDDTVRVRDRVHAGGAVRMRDADWLDF